MKFRGLVNKFINPVIKFQVRLAGCTVSKSVRFHGAPIVSLATESRVKLCDNVVLVSKSTGTALGVARPVILRTLSDNAEISVGADSGLSGTTVCAAISVLIGQRVLVGADVLITDTDFHEVNETSRRYLPLPESHPDDAVIIEDDVFIGARSIILKGVTIGVGSVIGAGSVVTKSIPAGVVAAGNPARAIRSIVDVNVES